MEDLRLKGSSPLQRVPELSTCGQDRPGLVSGRDRHLVSHPPGPGVPPRRVERQRPVRALGEGTDRPR